MAGTIQPLAGNFKIVNEDGTPTLYFTRWAQQRQIDISGGITAEQAQQLIDDASVEILAEINAKNLIAGTGLSGGGLLENAPLTFNLEDTAVTPGTYGDSTHVAKITVDQQGRVTDAENVAISGGGGLSLVIANNNTNTTVSNSSFATKGSIFTPINNIVIRGIYPHVNAVAGHNYIGQLLTLNSATHVVSSVLATSATYTAPASGESYFLLDFGSSISLTAGTSYCVCFTDVSSASGTTALSIWGAGSGSGSLFYRVLPIKGGNFITIPKNSAVVAGDSWNDGGNVSYWIDILGAVTL